MAKPNKRSIGNEITSIDRIISEAQSVKKGKIEYLRSLQQGGISDDVFNLTYVQKYISDFSGNCCGYWGADRPMHLDKWIEKNRQGTNSQLGEYLCSKMARYFADENKKDIKALQESYRVWKGEK